jgi:hypothetical protein
MWFHCQDCAAEGIESGYGAGEICRRCWLRQIEELEKDINDMGGVAWPMLRLCQLLRDAGRLP